MGRSLSREMVYASFPYANQWVGCVPTAAPHYQWPEALSLIAGRIADTV
jgi:hypothetical protein